MKKNCFYSVLLILVLISQCSLLPQKTKIEKIEFAPMTAVVSPGGTTIVAVTIEPSKAAVENNIVYSVDNSNVADITYTNTSVMLLGKNLGTTRVDATVEGNKVASFLVTVVPPGNGDPETTKYITTSKNTVLMKIGVDTTLTAELVNGTPIEQQELSWTTTDAAVLSIMGNGSGVIVSPLAAGQTQILVKHPLSVNTCTINVKVDPISQPISLNKTGVSMIVGGEETLTATIQNGTTEDYNAIRWTKIPLDSNAITILGNGKSVTLLAANAGTLTVQARTQSGTVAYCDVLVTEPNSLEFSKQQIYMTPAEIGEFTYIVMPENAQITWMNSDPTIADISVDSALRKVTITPIIEGKITITGRTSSGIIRTANVDIWFDNITVHFTGGDVGGTNLSLESRNYTWINDGGSRISVGDRRRLQVNVSIAPVEAKVNKIEWVSVGFDSQLYLSQFDDGKYITLWFEPDWTLLSELRSSGTLVCKISYGNNKQYTKTFSVQVWAQNF
jgi:hypothetical protein